MTKILDLYYDLFDFLCEKKIKEGKYLPWQAHCQIVTVLSTGILMWGYALLASIGINHPLPGKLGFLMATTHLLSPLLLRFPGNIHLAAHTLIASGLIHQATFSYFSGGFNSNIIIWFGILPMIGGIILGRIGIVIWAFITSSVAGFFLYQGIFKGGLTSYISEEGWLTAQAMMVFGWIFLSTILIYVFILLMEKNDREQTQKNIKIRTLVRVLCHDISNPLTTIRNRLTLLKRTLEKSNTETSLSKVDRPIEAIQSIIEQIRDWEAIESGKKEIELQAVNINDTINFVQDIFDEKLRDKDIKLNIDIPGTELMVSGEKTTIQSQIFSNILSNAIKFSDPGSTIDIIVKDEGDFVKASISDQGMGIPQKMIDDLFDATKKTSRMGTSGEKGTGFGLPIVKAYVEKFGGVIKVTSKSREEFQDDSGTTFELNLRKLP